MRIGRFRLIQSPVKIDRRRCRERVQLSRYRRHRRSKDRRDQQADYSHRHILDNERRENIIYVIK